MREGGGILEGGVVHPDVEGAIAAARGRGRPLELGLSHRAGAQFGDSFGDVRVHTDAHAAELSRAVSARAFTVGSDIFFAAGEYSPGTPDGNELIAHELAHVVQQRGAPPSGPLRSSRSRATRSSARPRPPRRADGAACAAAELRAAGSHSSTSGCGRGARRGGG